MKSPLAILLIASVIGIAAIGRADTVVVANFEGGLSGFKGQITVDSSVAKEGKGSGKMVATFDEKTRWITAARALDHNNELKTVKFWVKSSEFTGLTIRLIDSTGQTHQQRPKFAADGDWHQIVISSFTSGPGYQKYGGANDGTFHWPATSLALIPEKGNLSGKDSGTLWMDQVELETVGAPRSALADYKAVMLADFEKDAGGFTEFKVEAAGAKNGVNGGRLTADFTQGGRWVTAKKSLDLKGEIKALSFWIKSTEANWLTVRSVDETGQTHQQKPGFDANGQWQQVTITRFDGGNGYQKWGGANDGKVHWPVKELSFILERDAFLDKESKKATVWVDDVQMFVAP